MPRRSSPLSGPARSLLTVAFVLGAVSWTAAQTQPLVPDADEEPIFRSGVTLVTTDVIVRDTEGVFIPDLQPQDFIVREDGQQQEVASLVLVHGGRVFNQLVPPAPVQEGIILPTARATNNTAGRIIILFVDDLHLETSLTPRLRQVFRTIADTLIHEGDLFGILSTGPSSLSVDLTYDRSILRDAEEKIMGDGFSPQELIESMGEGPRGPAELSWRTNLAFRSAREMVRNLEQVENRRKVFIYFSSGYDLNPFSEQRITRTGTFGQGSQGYDGERFSAIADPLNDPFELAYRRGQVFADTDLVAMVAELTRAANRANTSFYTVDPRGLVAGSGSDYNLNIAAFQEYLFTTQNSLRMLAELTGGIAVVNRNDFEDVLQEIDAETSDYYVLGFYTSNPDPTQRTRELAIDVNRDGVDVKARSSYTFARSTVAVPGQ